MSPRHRQICWVAVVSAVWAVFLGVFVEMRLRDATSRELLGFGLPGLALALGMLMSALRWWPKADVPQGRRQAMVGGRPIGAGWVPPAPRVTDPPDMLAELRRAEGHALRQNPTLTLPKVAEGRAVVVTQPVVETDVGAAVERADAALDMAAEAYERGRRDGELDGFNRGVMSVQDPDDGGGVGRSDVDTP